MGKLLDINGLKYFFGKIKEEIDKKLEEISNTLLDKGINDNTVEQVGGNAIAGAKGYYYRAIDITNKKIYLSNTQIVIPVISTDDYTDKSFTTPNYTVGNGITLINNSKYDYGKNGCTATIKSITNNVITYDGELGFTTISDATPCKIDDYSLFVPAQYDEGYVNIREGSIALGDRTVSSGLYSFAEGRQTKAYGHYSHAEGRNTVANYAAHAEGLNSQAYGDVSHSEGQETISTGLASHAEGSLTQATEVCAHSEGHGTKSTGFASHAEGYLTEATATGAHSEGQETKSTGPCSHAEGFMTQATATGAHSEGYETKATGIGSHAEGYGTATGSGSHAEGYGTATGSGSHAEGYGTIAASAEQHVEGKYNVEDTKGIYAHIVGNGLSNIARSNAHTLDWNGNAWFAGEVRVGNNFIVEEDVDLSGVDILNPTPKDPSVPEILGNSTVNENGDYVFETPAPMIVNEAYIFNAGDIVSFTFTGVGNEYLSSRITVKTADGNQIYNATETPQTIENVVLTAPIYVEIARQIVISNPTKKRDVLKEMDNKTTKEYVDEQINNALYIDSEVLV